MVHTEAPVLAWKLPAPHALQEEAPVDEYFPTAQFPQPSAPLRANVPPAQLAHADAPVRGW